MIKLLVLIMVFIAFIPTQAQASYWFECKVHAQVRLNIDTGFYEAKIKRAIVSGGHDKKGTPCLKDMIGKTVKIKIKGNPPEGKTVRLKYKFYNEFGGANIEKWSYYPLSIRDIFPW